MVNGTESSDQTPTLHRNVRRQEHCNEFITPEPRIFQATTPLLLDSKFCYISV